jgi:predicted DNA-binding WGR domain protein
MMEKPASTWSFDQGTLTVHYLGKTVSLGRYATHEFAAKAAAVYFAKHQARKKRSALRPASSAARMLSQNEWRADIKRFKRADAAASEATSINRATHQPLTEA